MKAKFIFETQNFQRKIEPKRAMGTGDPIIAIELTPENIQYQIKNGKIIFDLKDEDTKFFVDVIKKNKIEYQFISDNPRHGPTLLFKAQKSRLIPLIELFDAYGRDEDELKDALKNWWGDENELGEIIW